MSAPMSSESSTQISTDLKRSCVSLEFIFPKFPSLPLSALAPECPRLKKHATASVLPNLELRNRENLVFVFRMRCARAALDKSNRTAQSLHRPAASQNVADPIG